MWILLYYSLAQAARKLFNAEPHVQLTGRLLMITGIAVLVLVGHFRCAMLGPKRNFPLSVKPDGLR